MAQHDYVLDNQAGAAFRSDLNDALAAIVSQNSGATEPTTTFSYQWWADTTAGLLKRRNAANSAWISVMDLASGLVVGTDVQAYDADTAKTDVAQTFSASQRGTVTADNDLSFDLSVTNNFSCTPTGTGTLTFTNHTAGQSGFILLDNSSGYAISAAATTKINAADLSAISAAGTYVLSYFDNGTNTYVMVSRSFA